MSWSEENRDQFLRSTIIPVRISFLDDTGGPRVASLWYSYDGRSIWCATQEGSFVARCLARDARCAVEVAADHPPYRGVRARGKASLHRDLGATVLEGLMKRYLGRRMPRLQEDLRSRASSELAIEIEPQDWFSWDFTERMR